MKEIIAICLAESRYVSPEGRTGEQMEANFLLRVWVYFMLKVVQSLVSLEPDIVIARLMVSSTNFRSHLKKLMIDSCGAKCHECLSRSFTTNSKFTKQMATTVREKTPCAYFFRNQLSISLKRRRSNIISHIFKLYYCCILDVKSCPFNCYLLISLMSNNIVKVMCIS